MAKDNLVPLDEIFRHTRSETKEGRAQTVAQHLQGVLRSRTSLSLFELAAFFDMLDDAALPLTDLVVLENLARSRAAASERTQGWHAGFADMVKHLTALRAQRKAA